MDQKFGMFVKCAGVWVDADGKGDDCDHGTGDEGKCEIHWMNVVEETDVIRRLVAMVLSEVSGSFEA